MENLEKPLNLIVSCAENRVMGRGGKLPWNIPEDRAWFLEKTCGQIVVLGRICYEIWPGAHEDGRRPIVITNSTIDPLPRHSMPAGAAAPCVVRSVREALQKAQELPGEVFVCGGARIFEETLPIAQRLYLTLVHAKVAGDALFPEWRHLAWRESYRKEGNDATHRLTFSILERQKK
ncbi:MAG: dihydrofolate reductase [Opitutaceae bacterium]